MAIFRNDLILRPFLFFLIALASPVFGAVSAVTIDAGDLSNVLKYYPGAAPLVTADQFHEGEITEGLTVAAMPLQRVSDPAFAIPLLVVITNRGSKSIAVPMQFWSASLFPLGDSRQSITRSIGVDAPDLKDLDFYPIVPGGHLVLILHATPSSGAEKVKELTLALDIPCPESVRRKNTLRSEIIFTGRDELISGAIHLSAKLPPAPIVGQRILELVRQGAAKISDQSILADSQRVDLIRALLGAANQDLRFTAISHLGQHPLPSLAQDLLTCLSAWGPSQINGGFADSLKSFSKSLPEKDQAAFLRRCVEALQWNWREAFALVSSTTQSGTPAERSFAGWTFSRYINAVGKLDEWSLATLRYAIIYCSLGRSPDLRDPERAKLLLDRWRALAPNHPELKLIEAVLGNQPKVDASLIEVVDSAMLNGLAWDLAQCAPTAIARSWMVEIARSAAKRSPDIGIIDTLVAAEMADGRLDEALTTVAWCQKVSPGFAHVLELEKAIKTLKTLPEAKRTELLATFDYDHPESTPINSN